VYYSKNSYGLSADARAKLDSKWDDTIAKQVSDWITQVTGTKIADFHEDLKDGVLLCNFLNTLVPGAVSAPKKSKAPFVMMENINAYLAGCRNLGLSSVDLFQTVDLYEAKNMSLVLMNLHALWHRYAKK